MKKQELLRALQGEIRRHDFSTFLDEKPSIANGGPGVAVPGMPGLPEADQYHGAIPGSPCE
jgi:hypothetical protein